jgi:hypothetical protein
MHVFLFERSVGLVYYIKSENIEQAYVMANNLDGKSGATTVYDLGPIDKKEKFEISIVAKEHVDDIINLAKRKESCIQEIKELDKEIDFSELSNWQNGDD